MRIFVKLRNKGNIESDERFSKSNYGSRTSYSIDDAILEKILVFDHSIVMLNHTIYLMTCLQDCYDR